jgi:hypothetical protein
MNQFSKYGHDIQSTEVISVVPLSYSESNSTHCVLNTKGGERVFVAFGIKPTEK